MSRHDVYGEELQDIRGARPAYNNYNNYSTDSLGFPERTTLRAPQPHRPAYSDEYRLSGHGWQGTESIPATPIESRSGTPSPVRSHSVRLFSSIL